MSWWLHISYTIITTAAPNTQQQQSKYPRPSWSNHIHHSLCGRSPPIPRSLASPLFIHSFLLKIIFHKFHSATFDPKTCVSISLARNPRIAAWQIPSAELPFHDFGPHAHTPRTWENAALIYFQLFVDVDVDDVVIACLARILNACWTSMW